MGRMSHRNQERTERRISAAASLMLCALTVLAQIAVTLLLTRFLKEKASFVYGFLQLIGAAVAIRVYRWQVCSCSVYGAARIRPSS